MSHLHHLWDLTPDSAPWSAHIEPFTFINTKTFKDCAYHNYRVEHPNGNTHISYCFDRRNDQTWTLAAIHLTGHFPSTPTTLLPSHLQSKETGKALVKALGEPTRKGKTKDGIWMSWDKLGIQVQLAAMDWEQPEAPIQEWILFKPTV
jgi:hypothetical protein